MSAKIIIADDDPGMRRILTHVMEMGGYEVIAVSDGLTALETIKAEKPALMLIDRMMPGMDGVSVIRKLRLGNPPNPLPVILLTASDPDEIRDEIAGLAGVEFVSKPFEIEALNEQVRKMLA